MLALGLELLELANRLEDKVGFYLIMAKERPVRAFTIAGDVEIPPGDYESIRGRIEFETAKRGVEVGWSHGRVDLGGLRVGVTLGRGVVLR